MIKKNWNPFVELTIILSIILIIILNFFMVLSNHRNNYTVKVVVTDKQTGEPIAGAMVSILPFFENKLTNNSGEVTLNASKADDYDVIYSREGWIAGDYKMNSKDWNDSFLNLRLEKNEKYTVKDLIIIPENSGQDKIVADNFSPDKEANKNKAKPENEGQENDYLYSNNVNLNYIETSNSDKIIKAIDHTNKSADANKLLNHEAKNSKIIASKATLNNNNSIINVTQFGTNNFSYINSIGSNNITVTQGFPYNPSNLNRTNTQINGSDNTLNLTQIGIGFNYSGQFIGLHKESDGNKFTVTQDGFNNYDFKMVNGNYNSFDIKQTGSFQRSYVNLSGDNSIISISQSGYGNKSSVSQNGNNSSATVRQSSQMNGVR